MRWCARAALLLLAACGGDDRTPGGLADGGGRADAGGGGGDGLVTFSFTAEVTELDDPSNFLLGSVRVGDPATGTYAYLTDVMPTLMATDADAQYIYDQPGTGMTLELAGTHRLTTDPARGSLLQLAVINDGPGGSDLLDIQERGFVEESTNLMIALFQINLREPDGLALDSVEPPRTAPDLTVWQQGLSPPLRGLNIRGCGPAPCDPAEMFDIGLELLNVE